MANKNLFNIPTRTPANYDGETVFHAEVADWNNRPQGDSNDPRPYLGAFMRIRETGDVLQRKLRVYEVAPQRRTDADGNVYWTLSPQETVLKELRACAGYGFADINEALTWLAKTTVPVYIEELPLLDEDGERMRDKYGIPRSWYKIRFTPVDETGKKGEPEPQEMAAEQEATRAKKRNGKRGYAGNTGE